MESIDVSWETSRTFNGVGWRDLLRACRKAIGNKDFGYEFAREIHYAGYDRAYVNMRKAILVLIDEQPSGFNVSALVAQIKEITK